MKTLNLTLLAVMVAVTGYAQEAKVEKPKALIKAQDAYEKECAKALEPINLNYLRTLESLKRDMGIRGDTVGMVAVQAAIDEVKEYLKNEGGTEDGAEKMVVGEWSTNQGSWHDVVTFSADHTLRTAYGDSGKWEVKNGNWKITYPNGIFIVKLPLKTKMIVQHSDGKTWTFEKQK